MSRDEEIIGEAGRSIIACDPTRESIKGADGDHRVREYQRAGYAHQGSYTKGATLKAITKDAPREMSPPRALSKASSY